MPPNPPSKKKRANSVGSLRQSLAFFASRRLFATFRTNRERETGAQNFGESRDESKERESVCVCEHAHSRRREREPKAPRERERERISDWILEKPSSEDLTTINNEHSYLFLERRRRNKRNAYTV